MGLLLALVSPLLLVIAATALAVEDIFFAFFGKRVAVRKTAPRNHAASIVIPNWNGRDLLEKFLPSLIDAVAEHPDNEIIIVDNASRDGSADFMENNFPGVRVLRFGENLGFGGGSNAGVGAAKNDIVVLLNNDMRVERGFLAPLVEPFQDPLVFSVSCQIFFSDETKRREETGLTESWWSRGRLRVSHRADPLVQAPFPCAYPGGGSSAFDRSKFLELGGFDELFRPFYYEDTDLGHLAWKSGWKVLYQPSSVVYHEHRGTIGKQFSADSISKVLKKNAILYCWKNIHDWRMLAPHFAACLASPRALARAFAQLPAAMHSRWRVRKLATICDREAFRRQRGGYYRDRFQASRAPVPDRLQVLFASPYPIEPPVHGGAVFMKQTLAGLAPLADIHLVSYVDKSSQLADQERLRVLCASAQFFVRHIVPPRNPSTLVPHAIREFRDPEFEWAIHRTIYLQQIDVLQLEYTILGQYAGDYRRIPCILFEHDIFFQSLWRGMLGKRFSAVGVIEYLRMLRYELHLLTRVARVQVCSRENKSYLLGFVPQLADRIDADLRAAIDTRAYQFVANGREPDTVLFVGSFRHLPNIDALHWLLEHVWPRVLQRRQQAILVIVGSDAPASLDYLHARPGIRLAGSVEDIRDPLQRHSVFVCPVLSGSGVRVKLLEAFASGIPVVSTRIGAEGLASASGEICELADLPEEFARAVARLLADENYASALAGRARHMVECGKDSRSATARLEQIYRAEAAGRRA